MSIITHIEPQKGTKQHYKVYMDDGQIISLHEELVVRYKLSVGKEIDIIELKQWVYEDQRKKAFDMAVRYLGYRARSRKEIEGYLKKKVFEDNVIEMVISKLEEYGYINDLDFAVRWVSARMTANPMGTRMMAYELRSKGVDEDIISQALDNVTQEKEYEAAYKLAEKYMKKYVTLEQREMINKVGQAMARRGFDWDIIRKVCRDMKIDV